MTPGRNPSLWRAKLSPTTRRRIRRWTDPLSGPLGSIRGARTEDRVVALTFDDGPDPAATPGVLDALARKGAQATFFVLVDRAEAHVELVRRMQNEGHDVGLHGVDHTRLTRLGWRVLGEHIAAGFERLEKLLGSSPRWFRPPYGAQNLRSFVQARRCGMEVVVWSADCEDWAERPEQQIADIATAAATPGGVLLLHDGMASDSLLTAPQLAIDRAKVAALTLEGLSGRGYRCLSMSALLDGRSAHRTAWFRP